MRKFAYYIAIALFALCLIAFAFYAATIVSANGAAREFVGQFGVLGILIVAFISGLNIVVPIHAATFTPIFIEAGFQISTIILVFVVGTTLADLVGYAIGAWGKQAAEVKHPRIHKKLTAFNERHGKLMFPAIFLYSAFVPFPNEVILIPLGLIGFRLRTLIIPLVLGTFLNHTLYTFGFINVFEALF